MKNDSETLSLISTGMITANGGNTAMVAASVKAGITCINETHYYNKRNKAIRMAVIPDEGLAHLDEDLNPVQQFKQSHTYLLQVASQALLECLQTYTPDEAVPIFMSCPEITPGTTSKINADFIKHLQIQSKANIDLQNSKLFYTGRAGGFQAIELAFKFLQETGREFVLVGGVDSYQHCLQQLSMLDNEDRLLVEDSLDGFIPGDAGGFLLLASNEAREKRTLKSCLTIGYPSSTQEAGHRYSETPYLGDGLASAFQQALTYAPNVQINSLYCSMNGESFGSKEFGVALTRNSKRLASDIDIKHPADCFGDIGAAFGPVLLGLLSQTNSCSSLAYCSSDGAYRSAVCAWK